MESTNYLFSGGLSPAQCFDILKDSKYSDFVVRCDGKSFRVHKFMLATKSDYFRAAIDGGFKESAENQITMMDVRPAAMAVVILYLYWGATSLSQFYPHLNSTFHDQFTPLEINYIQSFAGHLDIYLLADRLMLPGLRSLADEAVGWSLARLRKDGRIAELEESARMVYERIPETDGYIRPNITAAMVSDPAMPKHVPKQYDPAGVAACLHLLSRLSRDTGLVKVDATTRDYYHCV